MIYWILSGIIAALLAERFWDRHRMLKMQDMMNRAFLARSVPEYEATARSELKKMKLENQNVVEATKLFGQYVGEPEEKEQGIPIS